MQRIHDESSINLLNKDRIASTECSFCFRLSHGSARPPMHTLVSTSSISFPSFLEAMQWAALTQKTNQPQNSPTDKWAGGFLLTRGSRKAMEGGEVLPTH